MKIHHCLSVLVLGAWMLGIIDPLTSWAATSYTVEDLQVNDALKAAGPNLSGQATVRSGFVQARSSLKTPGVIAENINTDGVRIGGLLVPRSDHFTSNGINDAGDVVGSANGKTSVRAVLWTKTGGLKDLGTLPGDSASEAFAINNSGAVVGYSSGPQGRRAFLWTAQGGMKDLGTLPGGNFSKAFGISDNETIIGSSASPMGTHAVLWDPSTGIQDLGILSGDITSEAFGINSRGDVVGYSRGPAGTRAFIWTSQQGMQGLPSLPGGSVTRALSINEKGEAVGSSGSFDGARAVLWSATGQAQDLNAIVSLPPGVVLLEAVGINAKGQIIALGNDEQNPRGFHEGSSRAFLITPNGP